MSMKITREPDGRYAIREKDGTRLGPLCETQEDAIQIGSFYFGYQHPDAPDSQDGAETECEARRLGRRIADIEAERGTCTFQDLQSEGWDIEQIGRLSEAANAEAARIKALREGRAA